MTGYFSAVNMIGVKYKVIMGFFDVFDSIVKKIDDVEQVLEGVMSDVDAAAAKVETTAKIVEEKASQATNTLTDDTSASSDND